MIEFVLIYYDEFLEKKDIFTNYIDDDINYTYDCLIISGKTTWIAY